MNYSLSVWDIWSTLSRVHTVQCCTLECLAVVIWRSASALVSINEVNLHRARLVPGWVIVSGFGTFSQRINFKLAKLCYLATYSFQQPGYLADLISPYSQPRLLRSSTQKLLSVPPQQTLLLVVSQLLLRDFGTLFQTSTELSNCSIR